MVTQTNSSKNYLLKRPSNAKSVAKARKRRVPLYIKYVGITNQLIRPLGIGVACKPTKLQQTILCKQKNTTTNRQTKHHLQDKVQRLRQTLHRTDKVITLCLRLHEHQLALKRGGIASLVSMYLSNCGHEFYWRNVELTNDGNIKKA